MKLVLVFIALTTSSFAGETLVCHSDGHGSYALKMSDKEWTFQTDHEKPAVKLNRVQQLRNAGAISEKYIQAYLTADSQGERVSIVLRKEKCATDADESLPYSWTLTHQSVLYSGCCKN